MRNLAIVGRDHPAATTAGCFELEGVLVRVGLVETEPPAFDPAATPGAVLVRVLGFSFNYRDRALVLRMATSDRTGGFYVGGSDFVAEVLAVGNDVGDLAPGDRVIPNCAWEAGPPDAHRGIPSNHASREIQVHRRDALLAIPPTMDPTVAAAFSIGGQTAFSMLRRLELPSDGRLLLTAPRSNTSLFCLAAMAARPDVTVCGLSSSGRNAERLHELGLDRLVVADPQYGIESGSMDDLFPANGFDGVIDPFCDLWLHRVVPLMGLGGRYVTCGVENQSSAYTGVQRTRPDVHPSTVLERAMLMNLSIMGNCLGSSSDLARAVDQHCAGDFPVVIDSTFDREPTAFLERTYACPVRLGKVVFMYS